MSATTYPRETGLFDQKVTSFLPVPTYTPSSGCYDSYRYDGTTLGLMAFDPAYGVSVNTEVTCEPAVITTWWLAPNLGGDSKVVSLGPLNCPDAWPTVMSSTKDSSSTMIMCCPSGYYLAGHTTSGLNGQCVSDVRSGQTFTYASTNLDSYTTLTTTLTAPSTVGAIALSGWNIKYETTGSSTSPASASASATSATSSSTSTTSTASASESSTLGASVSNSNSGLGTGATAGIAVGVTVGVIGLVALLVAFWILNRKSKAGAPAQPPYNQYEPNQQSPYQHPPNQYVRPPQAGPGAELPVTWQAELAGKEHGENRVIAELDGTR